MKKRTIVHSVFISLIALTIIGSVVLLIVDYHHALEMLPQDPDDMKWWGLGASMFLIIVGLVVLYELEVYRCVRYFVLCSRKHIFLTIYNIIAITLVPIITIIGQVYVKCAKPPSIMLLELPFLIIPGQSFVSLLIWLFRMLREG